MSIRVVDRLVGIRNGQIPGSSLTIGPIVCARNHEEVAHFVDQGACLRVCSGCRGRPESIAEMDLVGPIGIYIRIIVLCTAAVIRDGGVDKGTCDGIEVRIDRAIAGCCKGTEPGRIARV